MSLNQTIKQTNMYLQTPPPDLQCKSLVFIPKRLESKGFIQESVDKCSSVHSNNGHSMIYSAISPLSLTQVVHLLYLVLVKLVVLRIVLVTVR